MIVNVKLEDSQPEVKYAICFHMWLVPFVAIITTMDCVQLPQWLFLRGTLSTCISL